MAVSADGFELDGPETRGDPHAGSGHDSVARSKIARTPVAVEITPGMTEQLYGRDLVLEDIGRSAVVLGDARKAHHQVTLDNVVCRNVPQMVRGKLARAGCLT